MEERNQERVDRCVGCLLGGALGDALGAPVEFLSLGQIRERYGPQGIQELDEAYGRVGAITDDTQMTLFTAEGLIRALVRSTLKGICHAPGVIGYSYQRWLHTQGVHCNPYAIEEDSLGWLTTQRELHSRRAPGNTCISALRTWNHEPARNDSKGCGTVMRSAPFGFAPNPWQTAWDCAAISHGHQEAKASAAAFARIIEALAEGIRLRQAIEEGIKSLALVPDCTTQSLLVTALELADSGTNPEASIRKLGEGWVADEALAIGAYCALVCKDSFVDAVRLAVNHSGDSDSTGSICGNLLGAAYGKACLPAEWLSQLELRDVIEEIATDLVTEIPVAPWYDATPEQEAAQRAFTDKYPGC